MNLRQPPMGRRTVIYIAGAAHSGSTFLDIMLGEAEAAFSSGQIGEIHKFIDDRNQIRNELMGDLPIWRKILDQLSSDQRRELKQASLALLGEKSFFKFLLSKKERQRNNQIFDLLLILLFQANPSAKIIIDSSKNITRALALCESVNFDTYIIHLIRDCRGYISSSKKRSIKSNKRHSTNKNILYWLIKNICSSIVLKYRYQNRYVLIKYENLILHPTEELKKISNVTGMDTSEVLRVIEGDGSFSKKQMVGGNFVSTLDSTFLDKSKLLTAASPAFANLIYWLRGGWLSMFWGYDFRQSYVEDVHSAKPDR